MLFDSINFLATHTRNNRPYKFKKSSFHKTSFPRKDKVNMSNSQNSFQNGYKVKEIECYLESCQLSLRLMKRSSSFFLILFHVHATQYTAPAGRQPHLTSTTKERNRCDKTNSSYLISRCYLKDTPGI